MNSDFILPELLSIEELRRRLIGFIQEDKLPVDREILIEFAYRWTFPLAQRQFRSNRSGILITQNQKQIKTTNDQTNEINERRKTLAGEKHQADQGIYTIHKQQSSTAPIKLKRTLYPASTGGDIPEKRWKIDEKSTID